MSSSNDRYITPLLCLVSLSTTYVSRLENLSDTEPIYDVCFTGLKLAVNLKHVKIRLSHAMHYITRTVIQLCEVSQVRFTIPLPLSKSMLLSAPHTIRSFL